MAKVHPAPEEGRFTGSEVSISRSLAAVVVLCLCVASAPRAAGLSLAEAERLAIERDAVLRQLESESVAMRERAVAEGQLMDPKMRFGAVNVPVDSFSLDAEDMTMIEVGVSQEFQAGSSRELARKRMEQSASAAEAVGAHEFIHRLKDGYQTFVEEGGVILSVGQRQLVSFARAVLADPRILTLDEATSSVDTLTEKAIQHALATLLKGRTALVIAHRR